MLGTAIVAALTASSVVVAQDVLVDKRFQWNNLPYKADTYDGERGRQSGYNICNSTTEGQDSLCQTAHIVSVDNFCLWAPQEPNGIVGNIEGEMVAWCTQPGYGTRVIPPGALTGVQFMKTPHYVQVTGLINQELIYIDPTDEGGEMDPHGADQRGNPLGGLLFSPSFGGNATPAIGADATSIINGSNWQQVIEWQNFMGGNQFCLRACDPSYDQDYRLCDHVYDRVGCGVNAPAAYANGTFESCQGEDQLPPGVYVGADGATSTWYQPGEGTPIGELPYTPAIPASSSCTSYRSEELYATLAASSSAESSSAMPTASGSASASGSSGASGSGPVATGSSPSGSASPSAAPTSAGHSVIAPVVVGVLALFGSALVLA